MIKIDLVRTSATNPEEYDAFDEQHNKIGYLRLLYGLFTVECPDISGELVFDAKPKGELQFEKDERPFYLGHAMDAIAAWVDRRTK